MTSLLTPRNPRRRFNQRFAALIALIAMCIGVGGMACVSTVNDLDKSDETDGAT